MVAVANGGGAQEPPLARLFAIALRSLVDELHEHLVRRGWNDVRPAFGFVLLATRDRTITSTELATLMGTTKQATSKLIASMATAGYVERTAAGQDARQRPVGITQRGKELLSEVERIYFDLESEWAETIGRDALEVLRGDLTAVLQARHGGQLPAVRPVGGLSET